jgi:hypothetical protein
MMAVGFTGFCGTARSRNGASMVHSAGKEFTEMRIEAAAIDQLKPKRKRQSQFHTQFALDEPIKEFYEFIIIHISISFGSHESSPWGRWRC